MHLIELAEARANEARAKADKVALAAAAKISDLDQEETPETIMLNSMTYEGAKDRTNREVVVPWLKFLWETYRTVLELLYKNARLERIYHKTCEKAFRFCQDYLRHNEFRRLCEMMRSHFTNLQRATQLSLRANKPAWEWTSEGVEFHLQTRFFQLEVATSLELWNEGFRTVEDIYEIMQINKKTPKPRLMASYYEKLTRIFFVSENYLFHAYAWCRYFSLCVECKLKVEERSQQAACVLLAALCIPNLKETESHVAALDIDLAAVERNAQMALLLDFQSNPTRQALLAEVISKGVLAEVPAEVGAVYSLLETGFRPLSLLKELSPLLTYMKNDPLLTIYVLPLQRVAILRTVMQLSRVFSTLRISSLKDLVAGLDISYCDIEKLLIDSAASKQISLRVDHASGCIRFGVAVAASAAIETQVSQLGAQLNQVVDAIAAAVQPERSMSSLASRKDYLEKIADSLDDLYAEHIERKNMIERRKEGLEKAQMLKQKEEQKIREAEEARRREEESQRLVKEEEQRKIEKEKKIKDQIDVVKTKKALEAHGKIVDESVLLELDEVSRRALLKEAQTDAQKAREEEARRLHEQNKRLDYITRALRLEAAEIISARYRQDVEKDRKEFDERVACDQLKQKEDHAAALKEKARLAKVLQFSAAFEASVAAKQKVVYDAKVAAEYEVKWKDHLQRKVARARQLREDELERIEEEERELEEQRAKEAAALRLEEEKEAKRLAKIALEEEKRARDADLERRRQEQIANVARQRKEAEEAAAALKKTPVDEEPRWTRIKADVPVSETRPSVDVKAPAGRPVISAATTEPWRGRGSIGETRQDPRPEVRSESRPEPRFESRPEPRPVASESTLWRGAGRKTDAASSSEVTTSKPLSGLDRLAAAKTQIPESRPLNSKWGGSGGERGRDAKPADGENSRWR